MAVNRSIFDKEILVMGVLNATPDSFSDGGRYFDPDRAATRGLEMIAEGADIVDVGGESTRPGSEAISVEEELRRVIPVIERLVSQTDIPISVDTVKPEVAEAAVAAGAQMINDVSCLRDSDQSAKIAARYGRHLVLMHSRGTPQTMCGLCDYTDVVKDVCKELSLSVETALAAGVPKECIWVDPGIGFAKTWEQSIELIARLDEIVALGYKVIVGPSRKSFIGKITGAGVDDRLGGTAAAVTTAILLGAKAVRVHDVSFMCQAALVAKAAASARSSRREASASVPNRREASASVPNRREAGRDV
jgi:dihydropteroate synthase